MVDSSSLCELAKACDFSPGSRTVSQYPGHRDLVEVGATHACSSPCLPSSCLSGTPPSASPSALDSHAPLNILQGRIHGSSCSSLVLEALVVLSANLGVRSLPALCRFSTSQGEQRSWKPALPPGTQEHALQLAFSHIFPGFTLSFCSAIFYYTLHCLASTGSTVTRQVRSQNL